MKTKNWKQFICQIFKHEKMEIFVDSLEKKVFDLSVEQFTPFKSSKYLRLPTKGFFERKTM